MSESRFSHISIYKETKKNLIRKKGELEQETGKFYSMDAVIKYLLSLDESGGERGKKDG